MSDLLRSYRALPTGQRAVVVGVGLIVAIVLLVNLPHIMGTAIAVGLTLVVLAFCAAALGGLVALVYLLVRAIGSRP